MIKKTYTYGVLPPKQDVLDSVGENFSFGNDQIMGNETLTPHELWDAIASQCAGGSDDQLEWVSCVLTVLGFEWV